MKHRIPKRYVVLISRTGEAPITLSFQPLAVFIPLAILIAAPIVWVSATLYSYAQRNSMLTEEATRVLRQLEQLDAEVRDLRERAGISIDRVPYQDERAANPQGGAEIPISAETMFEAANARLPILLEHLKEDVEPALDATLTREAARPKGSPLKVLTEVSSPFGLRRNPFGRGYEFHQGMDFTGSYGTPVHVTAPGIVEKAEFSRGFGNHVVVNHGYGLRTLYAHLSEIGVVKNARVEESQVIGYLGSTGRSSGPHLHYSVYLNGQAVDPQDYLD